MLVKTKKTSYLKEGIRLGYQVLRRSKIDRSTTAVLGEYDSGWLSFKRYCDEAKSLEQWLSIPGIDECDFLHNKSGKLCFGRFNTAAYNRELVRSIIEQQFKQVNSVTEYGSGLGRNLLYLKNVKPTMACYGFELSQEGVDISINASKKFGLDVAYQQLDYLYDPDEKIQLPPTDIAFTLYSLEQIPKDCDKALDRMLSRVKYGTIHIEPVPENYPYSYRGILGRIDHWKLDYLKNFKRAVAQRKDVTVQFIKHNTAHNPLMFPSIYILKKKSSC